MAHPMESGAKKSLARRLKIVGAKPGKTWGYSKMYRQGSYPSKNAGSETPMTIKGKSATRKSGHFAIGGAVKGKKKGGNTTNVNIVMPQGGDQKQPVPVPVPVPGGPPPGAPPIGALPPRPPMLPPGGPPPGMPMRPPGMKKGGSVKKAPFVLGPKAPAGGVKGKIAGDLGNQDKPELSKEISGGSQAPMFKRGGPKKKFASGGLVNDDKDDDDYSGFPKDPKDPDKMARGGNVGNLPGQKKAGLDPSDSGNRKTAFKSGGAVHGPQTGMGIEAATKLPGGSGGGKARIAMSKVAFKGAAP